MNTSVPCLQQEAGQLQTGWRGRSGHCQMSGRATVVRSLAEDGWGPATHMAGQSVPDVGRRPSALHRLGLSTGLECPQSRWLAAASPQRVLQHRAMRRLQCLVTAVEVTPLISATPYWLHWSSYLMWDGSPGRKCGTRHWPAQ